MRRIGQYLLFILFIALLIEIVIVAPQTIGPSIDSEDALVTEAEQDSSAETQESPFQAEQVMHGAHLTNSKAESKEWELWAKKGLGFKEKEFIELMEVRVIFFAEDGGQFVVTGSTGKIETATENITISGKVKTRSGNGYIFTTESVSYDASTRILYTSDKVSMISPADSQGRPLYLTGVGLTTDLNQSEMKILSQVEADKVIKDNKKVHVASDKAVFSTESYDGRFIGNVVMDMETMRMTGPEALFSYDPSLGAVTSVQIKGGVRVSDTDKWATSDQVNVEFQQEKLVFSGDPRVVQGDDELLGEEIIFLDGGKKVKVIKARARVGKESLRSKE